MRYSLVLLAFVALSGTAMAQFPPGFSKTFSPDVIGPGSTTMLTFTIDNSDARDPATDLAFSDVLPAGMTLATPAQASTTCGGGRTTPIEISAPDGGGTVTVSNGSVPGFSICEITVNVTASAPGVLTNTSSDLTSSAGNSGSASDDLTVATDRPGFSKSFSPSTVTFGNRSRLTFTIDNSANDNPAFRIQFTDTLPAGLVVASPVAVTTDCAEGTLTATPGSGTVSYTTPFVVNPNVPAGGICTIGVDVVNSQTGRLENVSSELVSASTFSGGQVSSGKAAALLTVVPQALTLTKSFTNDPVGPGGTVTLQFSILNLSRDGAATDIAFTDDLDATLAGLAAVDTPISACGGTLSGTDVLTFSGGTLPFEGSCTFSVPVSVPGGATPGTYRNTTSQITATVGGNPALGAPASDDLVVQAVPLLTKEFIDDPVAPGGQVTLQFSITNTSTASSATDLGFIDPLGFLGSPLSATLPSPGFCGAGSQMFATTFNSEPAIQVVGGNLAPGASCTFDVILNIQATFAGGTYTNTTEPITGTVGGASATGNRATDDLVVLAAPSLSKAFTDDPVQPGGTVTLEFTLVYSTETGPDATGIAFTDDLDAALSGLAATGTPISACGGTLSGTSTLTFSGGSLSPGEECTIPVTLQVPAAAGSGTYTNTTSELSSTVDGNVLTTPAATDDLVVSALTFTKEFTDDPVAPGGTVTLEFSIANTDPTQSATGMFFTDNLSATLSGLASTSGTQNDVCGSGSQIVGTTTLIFTGGNLAPGASCTFSVSLAVPGGAAPSTYTNTTSNLNATIGGTGVVLPPATDLLVVAVDPAPGFAKAFGPDEILTGGVSTLTFTIDNTPSTTAATSLDFTDDFPAGLVVASPANASTTCTGGTLTATTGSGTVSYTGGTVAAGATCTVSVDVTASEAGTYDNESGALTSSLGTSGTASATLTVMAPPDFVVTKDDDDASGNGLAAPGEVVTYIVTLQNVGGRADMDLTFSDTPDANTTLVAGSVSTTQGTVTTGNTSGDTSVVVNAGLLGPSASVTVQFDVLVTEEPPPGVNQICNQGSATDGSVTIPSDDPDTPAAGDPTCTGLDIPPPAIDAEITGVQAIRGEPFRVFGTVENTTFERLLARPIVTVTDPRGKVFIRRGKANYIEPGEIVGPVSAVRDKQLPLNSPEGTYTGVLEIALAPSGEVVDREEFSFTLGPIPPAELTASAALPGEEALVVLETRLPEAGPNPFSRQTTFRYSLADAATVSLRVYDATGREVAVLASGETQPGVYERVFDAGSLPAGVYLWRAQIGDEVATGRVTLLR